MQGFLGSPESFRDKVVRGLMMHEPENRPNAFLVQPEQLDRMDFTLPFRSGQKLLIFFSDQKAPYFTYGFPFPIVFEVIVKKGFEKNNFEIKGKIKDMFEIVKVWVPDGSDKWITVTAQELRPGKPIDPPKYGFSSYTDLMALLSQSSHIWHSVTTGPKLKPGYQELESRNWIPVSWLDIASFAAMEALKYHSVKNALSENILINIYGPMPSTGGMFHDAINKRKVL